MIDFADGKAQLVAVKAYYGGPLVGQQLRQIRAHMPNVDTRVAAIFRRDRPITPRGDTVIEADDEVFFIAARKDIRAVMGELRRIDESNKRVVIAGAGRSANAWPRPSKAVTVKIIEMSPTRCRHLSDTLESTVVLQGSASDKDLMLEENIADADIFLALTNDDEANIMSSLLAKRLGARKVMTIINNPAYVDWSGRRYRHRHQPAAGYHRYAVGPRAPRRHRQRALAAQGRGGGHRGGRAWRCQVEQSDRQGHRRHRPTARHDHRRDHPRRASADRPRRHSDRSG